MRKISVFSIVIIFLLVLSGCVTSRSSQPLALQSERLGSTELDLNDKDARDIFKKERLSSVYHFKIIIHSDPEGAEVWQTNGKLLGKTPMTISCYSGEGRGIKLLPEEFLLRELTFTRNKLTGKYDPDFKDYSGTFNLQAPTLRLHNIIVKKEGYYDIPIDEEVYRGSEAEVAVWFKKPITFRQLNETELETKYLLVLLRKEFEEQTKILTEQKKLKEAEELKNQRITRLKEGIEKEGWREEYVTELRSLKGVNKPFSSDMAKLKEDLDKAIKAGDYDKANNIKELIEYKEKSIPEESVKGIDEKAVKYNNEGLAYARQGYFSDALGSFKKAIEADPAYVDPYLNTSSCYVNLGNMQEAINYTEKALKIKPNSGLAYFYLATIYDILNKYDKAKYNYHKALAECAAGECSDDSIVIIKKRVGEHFFASYGGTDSFYMDSEPQGANVYQSVGDRWERLTQQRCFRAFLSSDVTPMTWKIVPNPDPSFRGIRLQAKKDGYEDSIAITLGELIQKGKHKFILKKKE